jgi:hypothetical protein
MPTTTNGLPYPLGTDPVANGAQDIEDLAIATDDGLGMWKVGGGTLSGTAVNFAGVFSSRFNVYKMFFYNVRNTTGGAELGLRLLSGTTPASGASDYSVQRLFAQAGSVGGTRVSTSYARASFIFAGASSLTAAETTIYVPNLEKRTNFVSSANYLDNSPVSNLEQNVTQHNQPTAYDGIQVISTDTLAEGTVQIFGIRV